MEIALLNQLTFEDCFCLKEKQMPKFSNGEEVFILILDTVIGGKINRSWICGEDEEKPYYGYGVDLEDGSHTVVWDYLAGKEVFKSKESATVKANSLSFEKIDPHKLLLEECRSFEYYRELDGYKLTATIAKIGEAQLYEHNFMCYHFIREYPNKKSRDKAYMENLSKTIESAERHSAVELQAPVLETLYRVNKSLYGSIGYAKHNGVRAIESTER